MWLVIVYMKRSLRYFQFFPEPHSSSPSCCLSAKCLYTSIFMLPIGKTFISGAFTSFLTLKFITFNNHHPKMTCSYFCCKLPPIFIDFLYISLYLNSKQRFLLTSKSSAALNPFVIGWSTHNQTLRRTSRLVLAISGMFRNLELGRKAKKAFIPLP